MRDHAAAAKEAKLITAEGYIWLTHIPGHMFDTMSDKCPHYFRHRQTSHDEGRDLCPREMFGGHSADIYPTCGRYLSRDMCPPYLIGFQLVGAHEDMRE